MGEGPELHVSGFTTPALSEYMFPSQDNPVNAIQYPAYDSIYISKKQAQKYRIFAYS